MNPDDEEYDEHAVALAGWGMLIFLVVFWGFVVVAVRRWLGV